MLVRPQKGVVRRQTNAGTVGSTSFGTSVTTGSVSTTKGTPAEMIASTNFDAYWIHIMAHSISSGNTISSTAIDILTGASTEEVLIPNLLAGYCGLPGTAASFFKQWAFPLYIPAGSRLAVQAASARTSTAMRVAVWLYGGDTDPMFRVGSKITTYGMGTVPNGTTITPGASGAEGSWTQIVASTTEDHWAFLPSYQDSNDATINQRSFQVDIGTGSATEEEMVGGSGWVFHQTSGEIQGGPYPPMPAFQDVPSGTRLAGRVSSNGTLDTGNENMVIHAVS